MTSINLEQLRNGGIRVTARESGTTLGYAEGAQGEEKAIICKVLDENCFAHKLATGKFDMTYITMNAAAKSAWAS